MIRRSGALVALALIGAPLAGCGGAASAGHTAGTARSAGSQPGSIYHYGPDPGPPSAPTTVAALAATRAFGTQVTAWSADLVASVTALQTDASGGDRAAAEVDEQAAQAAYDAIRALESGNPINASTIDELASDVQPGQSFGGLHAIERDLWAQGPLATDVSALTGQTPVIEFLTSRERLGPEAIGVVAVDQLNWVADAALPTSQERTSHLGLIDVAATVQAAHQAFEDIEPLATQVDPTRTAAVHAEFAALLVDTAALGPPATTPDTSVSPAAKLTESRQLDATAAALSQLAAELIPYGTAGAPS